MRKMVFHVEIATDKADFDLDKFTDYIKAYAQGQEGTEIKTHGFQRDWAEYRFNIWQQGQLVGYDDSKFIAGQKATTASKGSDVMVSVFSTEEEKIVLQYVDGKRVFPE